MTEFPRIRLVNSIQIEKTMRVDWRHLYSRFRVIHLLVIFLSFTVALNIKNAAMIVVRQGLDQPPEKLSVNDPRPVAEAVKQLQEKYGWIITYEDPRLSNESDLLDETDPKYRQAHPGGRRALAPKGGRLEVDYFVSPVTGKPENPGALLQLLLNAHAASANPGRFELKQTGQIFHVIPSQIKDASGRWVHQTSILDIPITFPEKERSVFETLETVTRSLSSASQMRIVIGTIPLNLFVRLRTTQSASSEPAREALIRTLESTNRKFSWRLLYDPGMKMFALNVRSVPN
jgi:hypothetical protein